MGKVGERTPLERLDFLKRLLLLLRPLLLLSDLDLLAELLEITELAGLCGGLLGGGLLDKLGFDLVHNLIATEHCSRKGRSARGTAMAGMQGAGAD